ncbi:SGNH/GDSL hydrolase family protein [Sphingomicrobium arenosum]|uniref:SGNH/GDSL hydrolase family protein n=1 Tax=Sphingomicrobium arenosum TaxID=2233861 RepID=UPI00223F3BF1|nr:SGNH/GDSL hydrolase family protein [Sphingomicrobium arenosum]
MTYSRVYVIGDSLADSGNALALARWYDGLPFASLPAGTPLPELGYFEGRFTDGYTFADLISNKYVGLVSEPTFPFRYEDPWLGIPIAPFEPDPTGIALNFAYGGAQVLKGDEAVLDLSDQVDALQDALDNDIPADALIIVVLGGNDIRSLVPDNGPPTPPDEAYARIHDIIDDMLKHLGQLVRDGAVDILLSGVADIGVVPEYDADRNGVLDPVEQARADAASDYSQYLDFLIRTVVIPDLEARGANVTYAPLTDNESELGALSLILPTIAGLYGIDPAEMASDLLSYRDLLFFDDIHPTAQVHAIVGSLMMAQMTGQPWVEILPMDDAQAILAGSLDAPGASATIDVMLVAGTSYAFDLLGMSSLGFAGSLADPLLLLTGNGFSAGDDDSGAGFDAHLAVTVTQSGTYSLTIDAVGMVTGDYTLLAAMVGGAALGQGDLYVVSGASTLVLEAAGGIGTDVIRTSTSYMLAEGSEIELLETTNAKSKSAIDLTGNGFDQEIRGNAGDNRLDGGGGSDTFFGGRGDDIFVLDGQGLDSIIDYEANDRIDLTNLLSLDAGVDPVAAGYLRIDGGRVQLDYDGGGEDWDDVALIGGDSATFLYLSGGATTQVTIGEAKGGKGGPGNGGGKPGGGNRNAALLVSALGYTTMALIAIEAFDRLREGEQHITTDRSDGVRSARFVPERGDDGTSHGSDGDADPVFHLYPARPAYFGEPHIEAPSLEPSRHGGQDIAPLPDDGDLPLPSGQDRADPMFADTLSMPAPIALDGAEMAVIAEESLPLLAEAGLDNLLAAAGDAVAGLVDDAAGRSGLAEPDAQAERDNSNNETLEGREAADERQASGDQEEASHEVVFGDAQSGGEYDAPLVMLAPVQPLDLDVLPVDLGPLA